ncbi:hypothetical protein Ancab_027568 [Ancistrocladus abbreviatus]
MDKELAVYHHVDRELYRKLVLRLYRNPMESIHVIAFFLYLEERLHCFDLISKIMEHPLALINMLADEAVACLNCINGGAHAASCSSVGEIPILCSISNKNISLQFFCANRAKALEKITILVNKVCMRALNDIKEQGDEINRLFAGAAGRQ